MDLLQLECCHICQKPLSSDSHGLCQQCWQLWPVIPNPCLICSVPISTTTHIQQICGHCLQRLPAYDFVISGGVYEGIAAWLIKQLKYHDRPLHIRPLARALLQIIEQRSADLPEVLIPMPLHWTRKWHRGFNQSYLLANAIGRQLQIPVEPDLVKRLKRTPPLEGLDRKTRQRLLQNVFTTNGPIPATTVAIVDDVVTTGASIQALSMALKKQGVQQVQVWTVARTAHSGP